MNYKLYNLLKTRPDEALTKLLENLDLMENSSEPPFNKVQLDNLHNTRELIKQVQEERLKLKTKNKSK